MNTYQITGFASWANHLVNGDSSDLSESEFLEMQRWLARYDLLDSDCLSAGDETFFGCPAGLSCGGDCVTYTFFARE